DPVPSCVLFGRIVENLTWGVLPFLLVNGPALERLGIETCGQLISKGENRAIGRARLMHGQPMHCGVTSRRSFARIAPNSDPGAP
ncbi:MAG: hypothetical protein ACXWUH_20175, partial [Burkholderiales bacterium]